MQSKKSKIKYSRLPSEYQEVEYIESSETQYINTGVNIETTDKITLTLAPLTTVLNKTFFGAYKGNNELCEVSIYNYAFRFNLQNLDTMANNPTVVYGDEYTFVYNAGKWKYQNVDYGKTQTINLTGPAYIFARNRIDVNQVDNHTSMRLYSCQIERGGSLIRNFIPCYRKSDNEIGLYDTVNDVFYTNAGTGTFLKGNDINDKTSLLTYTASKNLNLLKLTRTEWNSTSYQPADTVVFDYNKLYYMAGSGYIRPYDNALNETITNHSVEMTATGSSWWGIGFPIKVSPSTKYTISAKRYDGNKTKLLYTVYNTDGTFSRYGQLSTNVNILDITYTITMGANEDTLIVVVAGITQGDTVYAYDIQVEEGQTATEFMPYGKGAVKSICEMIKYARLPNEYQEVKYIESTGTQYIDTGVISSYDLTINADIAITENKPSSQYRALFGNETRWVMNFAEDANGIRWVGEATKMYQALYTVNKKFNIYAGKDFCYIDNVSITSSADSNLLGFGNFLIGKGYYATIGKARFYSFRIYDSDVLVRNFIPCYRKSDSVAGMYDMQNNQFYTNAGTGTFTVGGDIN